MSSLPPSASGTSSRTEHVGEGGKLVTLTVERPAHGGTFVGRLEGRVVFVRGAAPGETVTARLLPETKENDRFWRAEAIEVIEASPDRVESIWPEAGTDGIGGADFAHIQIEAQRRIKTVVLQELLSRAGLRSFDICEAQVQPAKDDADGLGWRTRVRFAVSDSLVGMRGWRSHEVFHVGANPLAHEGIRALELPSWKAPAGVEAIDALSPSAGPPAVIVRATTPLSLAELRLPEAAGKASVLCASPQGLEVLRGRDFVKERVGQDSFEVAAGGFWQVHVDAPRLLTEEVLRCLLPGEGERVWDLYGGAGLFSRPLARAVGTSGALVSVEGSDRANRDAVGNVADLPQARAVKADVADFVRKENTDPDRVVVDPPRAGVGEQTMRALVSRVKSTIVYVSCEPSTLARDLVVAEEAGWRVSDIEAFDLFPHTHHMETVALLERA